VPVPKEGKYSRFNAKASVKAGPVEKKTVKQEKKVTTAEAKEEKR